MISIKKLCDDDDDDDDDDDGLLTFPLFTLVVRP